MVRIMAMIAEWLKVDGEKVVDSLQDACEKLDTSDGELILDFSGVERIDPGAIKALEKLADKADQNKAKVALRGVRVDVYRVLKLVKLTRRFSFVN
jgi:anti-anti-sigma regulatory factor